ncbi:MAG: SDR family oxidoreductase [Thermoguttaceae bacterium]|nr:SDR family oxidoreductase [Thermoguttaceae bacterium]
MVASVRMSRQVGARLCENQPQSKSQKIKPLAPARPLILFFSWDGAFRGRKGETSLLYATAKGAVAAAAKSLAQQLAPHVRVCTISPGWIKTSWGKGASSQAHRRACSESLSGRWGTPEEIAAFVAYLLSPQADFLNGENFIANGGFRVP